MPRCHRGWLHVKLVAFHPSSKGWDFGYRIDDLVQMKFNVESVTLRLSTIPIKSFQSAVLWIELILYNLILIIDYSQERFGKQRNRAFTFLQWLSLQPFSQASRMLLGDMLTSLKNIVHTLLSREIWYYLFQFIERGRLGWMHNCLNRQGALVLQKLTKLSFPAQLDPWWVSSSRRNEENKVEQGIHTSWRRESSLSKNFFTI